MLAFLIRGVFFVSIISWYSASLWKAVDNYFKSQFQRYLDEEYQRNPRMRDDIRAYTTADKAASDLITVVAQQRLVESCSSNDVCPIDKAELASIQAREVKSHDPDESVPVDFGAVADGAGAAEIEVARPSTHTDQPAFQHSPVDEVAVPPLAELHHEEIPQTPTAIRDGKMNESSIVGDIKEEIPVEKIRQRKQQRKMKEGKEKESKKEEKLPSPPIQKKTKAKKRPKIEAKSEVANKAKIKKRQIVPTLKLTENDFEEASRYSKIEYEDENRGFLDDFENDDEDFNGILLKDLPFKPMIDVYDLERVSQEEYCPLSLDDDSTCDELQSWP